MTSASGTRGMGLLHARGDEPAELVAMLTDMFVCSTHVEMNRRP